MIDGQESKRIGNTLCKIQSPIQDLTFRQLKIYYEENGFNLNNNFPTNLDFFTKDGKYNYNAYLFADNNKLSMKVLKYSGEDKSDLIENHEYGYCSIIKATYNILNKLDIENITKAKITSKHRIEKRLVDNLALKEAVINAIVDNDYSAEIPPIIEMFSDRIMITSRASLPQSSSKEEFLAGESEQRNKEIIRIFKDIKLIDKYDSGVKRILEVYDESVFNISQDFIRVTFMLDKEPIDMDVEDFKLNKN